jgi:hypothetical protein
MKERETSKKIHKLKVDTQFPFRIIGISSHENDYRLIWAVNSKLHYDFKKIGNLTLDDKSNSIIEFSRYYYEDEDSFIACYIVSNRCSDGYLLPEYRTTDYFLFLKGEIEPGLPEELAKKLKQVGIVSTAFVIDIKSLKSIKKLLHLDA